MGKLQAALDRISRKLRPAIELSERLQVPAQQAHTSALYPTDPVGIKNWLLTQNAFNSANSIKSLTRALQHNNRSFIAPATRLHILEHFEKPCLHALQILDTRFLYLDLPLPDDAENAFQMTLILCQEMAYGYKVALRDALHGQGKLGKAEHQRSINRTLEHLGRMVLRHAQIYRPWPDSLWPDANALMRLASMDKRAISKRGTEDSPQLTAIDRYARLCAMHLLDSQQYSPAQLQGLYATLARHSDCISFSKKTDHGEYCIVADNPPTLSRFTRVVAKETGAGTNAAKLTAPEPGLYFSLDKLAEVLAQQAQQTEHAVAVDYLNVPSMQKRSVPRATRDQSITAETGLQDIFALISATPPTEFLDSQFVDPNDLIGNTGHSNYKNNVLQPVAGQTDGSYGTRYLVTNESDGGFGLQYSGEGECRLKVGELIAHCYRDVHNNTSWHLAVIRWLNNKSSQSIQFGVKSLSEHITAVEVSKLIKGKSQPQAPMQALLANYQPIDSKAPLLVLPGHKFKPGETVGYRQDNRFQLVKLVEAMPLSEHFQCFAISAVAESISSIDTTPAVAATV